MDMSDARKVHEFEDENREAEAARGRAVAGRAGSESRSGKKVVNPGAAAPGALLPEASGLNRRRSSGLACVSRSVVEYQPGGRERQGSTGEDLDVCPRADPLRLPEYPRLAAPRRLGFQIGQSCMNLERYSVVVIGTGFASSFFLLEYLKHAPEDDRILVLERGRWLDPAWKMRHKSNSDVPFDELIVNRTPQKPWIQNIAFGGGSCWWGHAPRMHPNDFRTRTLYGIGADWPLSYEDLEPYYVRVEEVMGIAGSSTGPYPRSKPYRYAPHSLNAVDELLAQSYPGLHISLPSARSSSVATGRSVCCTNSVCSLCPIHSKFQVDLHNGSSLRRPTGQVVARGGS
jgi:hypothetical protein